MAWKDKLKALARLSEFPRAVYGSLGGRHWMLCVFFSVTGAYFEWHGKLEPSYAALVTAIAGFAVWRAVSEDRKEEKCGGCDNDQHDRDDGGKDDRKI